MTHSLVPTAPGLYWVSIDDGETVLETAVVRVSPFSGEKTLAKGGVVDFVDGSCRRFDLPVEDRSVVPFSQIIPYGHTVGFLDKGEFRVTWIGRVRPPSKAPKIGSDA